MGKNTKFLTTSGVGDAGVVDGRHITSTRTTRALCKCEKAPNLRMEEISWLPFVDTYRTFCLAPGLKANEPLLGILELTHLMRLRVLAESY